MTHKDSKITLRYNPNTLAWDIIVQGNKTIQFYGTFNSQEDWNDFKKQIDNLWLRMQEQYKHIANKT